MVLTTAADEVQRAATLLCRAGLARGLGGLRVRCGRLAPRRPLQVTLAGSEPETARVQRGEADHCNGVEDRNGTIPGK